MVIRTEFAGRLGNGLFETAIILSLAKKHNISWALPKWEYSDYFQIEWNLYQGQKPDIEIKEPNFDYHPEVFEGINFNRIVSLTGYWQSQKYWNWESVKESFKFKQSLFDALWERTDFRPGENDWAVHVRLGDYVGNKNYYHLPPQYYIRFFESNLDQNFYIFTDDYETVRKWFYTCSNVEFVDGCSAIEHLALMSQFQNHMIANSTFGWWGAKLSELYNKKVRVIRPDCLFTGSLAESCTGKDFYPDNWEKRDVYLIKRGMYLNKEIDFSQVTFVIPCCFDSKDRKQNIALVIQYIQSQFGSPIILGEQGGDFFAKTQGVKYIKFSYAEWHRTKMINEMIKRADTPIIANWDGDVLAPYVQVERAVFLIQNKGYDVVYPYDGTFVQVDRWWYDSFLNDPDLINKINGIENKMYYNGKVSYGGAVLYNKENFIRAGMENESFVNHGKEDVERFLRFGKIGVKVGRVFGSLYHMKHFRSSNSDRRHPFHKSNMAEYEKIKAMATPELIDYMSTWEWLKNHKLK